MNAIVPIDTSRSAPDFLVSPPAGRNRIWICKFAAREALLADVDYYDYWTLEIRTNGRGAGRGWKHVKVHPAYVEIRGITSHRRERYFLGFSPSPVARNLLRTPNLPTQVWVRLTGVS